MSPHGIAEPPGQRSSNSENKCRMARPLTLSDFIALGQTMYEESATIFFTLLSILAPQGTSWAKVLQSRLFVYSKPGLPMCQISSTSDKLSTRYLLPNFVDSVQSVTDRQTWPTKTVNYMSPRHIMRRWQSKHWSVLHCEQRLLRLNLLPYFRCDILLWRQMKLVTPGHLLSVSNRSRCAPSNPIGHLTWQQLL